MEHTKGEWKVLPETTIVQDEKGRTIALIYYVDMAGKKEISLKEAEANTHLISAAPNLLEVCVGLMKEANAFLASYGDPDPNSIFIKALQVIAKAKGKE